MSGDGFRGPDGGVTKSLLHVPARHSRIVTLTLNPAVDRSGSVASLAPNHKLRCDDERLDPGGGGLNVARLLTRLGADVVAIFPAGGPTGDMLKELVEHEDVAFEAVDLPHATRENFNIRDAATGNQYRFIFPGPMLSADDISRCCTMALRQVSPGSYFIASGSLPPGAPENTYLMLAGQVAERGGKFVLDTSGPALVQALDPAVEILKVSESELRSISPAPIGDRDHCIAAARLLLLAGPKMIAVTRGERGAILVTDQDVWSVDVPSVQARTSVGAGDCFLAALVWALGQQEPMQEALRLAVAAGSAALLQPGTGLADPADVRRLAEGLLVHAIHREAEAGFAA